MKRKELIFVNLLIVVLMGVFGLMAFRLMVNKNSAHKASAQADATVAAKKAAQAKCAKTAPIKIASSVKDPNLQRLSDYQNMCNSFVTNKLMIFTAFSQDKTAAQTNADEMIDKLKMFKQAGVTPFVMAEPYISDGAMSYKSYLAGAYDAGMSEYFELLKTGGVTDEMMGIWVPFPESNVPGWNNVGTDPHDFALCVNKYLALLKRYFPNAKGSILLSATTYQPDDLEWNNGDYSSLSSYVTGLDEKLVTSVGIEGFPWMSNAKQPRHTIFSATEFLQPGLALEMAQSLHTRDIWINSGTFDGKYTNDSAKTVHMSINQRKAVLDDILKVALDLRDYQENQYRVSINLFSENKSQVHEATDWSYFQDKDSEAVLKSFLVNAAKNDIPVSISDKTQ